MVSYDEELHMYGGLPTTQALSGKTSFQPRCAGCCSPPRIRGTPPDSGWGAAPLHSGPRARHVESVLCLYVCLYGLNSAHSCRLVHHLGVLDFPDVRASTQLLSLQHFIADNSQDSCSALLPSQLVATCCCKQLQVRGGELARGQYACQPVQVWIDWLRSPN